MLDNVDIAELYHENTKIAGYEAGIEDEPPPIDFGVVLSRFRLPQVDMASSCGLEEAITVRRSCRSFDLRVGLPLIAISRLLFFSCGYTAGADTSGEYPAEFYRAVPSAGAAYPIEVYPIILRVSGLPQGVYRYSVYEHGLELIRPGSFQQSLASWLLHQSYVGDASVAFVLAGHTERVSRQYGERSYRYMLMEAGHIAQNMCLLGSTNGLGSLVVGGFVDSAINRLLGLNGVTQISLYIVAVGRVPRQF